MNRANEAGFETVIEAHLLQHGYEPVPADAFDRERAIFPLNVLAFIHDTSRNRANLFHSQVFANILSTVSIT